MIDVEKLEFGLDTFGDMQQDDAGQPISAGQTIRNVVEQAVFADQLGLDHFSIGEHHRDDFAVSAPDTVLAGIATKTSRIKLGTGVTVLSSEDPVRVYQRFATIDALSNGRAEITAGRGSFIESFPLFGYELKDYSVLFEEKLELLVEILKENAVTWSGSTRAPLTNQEIYTQDRRWIDSITGRRWWNTRVSSSCRSAKCEASDCNHRRRPSSVRAILRFISHCDEGVWS